MKIGPYLLLNLVLIGAALFLYDTLRAAPARPFREPAGDYDPLEHIKLDPPVEPRSRPPTEGLLEYRDGAGSAELQELLARVESLEGEVARLRRMRTAGAGGGAGDDRPFTVQVGELENPEEPSFDDRSVVAFEVYLDEVNRRKAVARQRERIAGQIQRLDLGLGEKENEGIIDETVAYHLELTERYKAGWPKDEDARQKRREDFEALQQRYRTRIGKIVPADVADKIATGLTGLNRGFISER